MTTTPRNIKTFVSSVPLNMGPTPIGHTCTVFIGSRTNEQQRIFQKLYLRLGRLVIRPLLPSTVKEDITTWHNTLICLAIFRRFMNTANLGKDTRSVSARLSGLLTFWSKKYETYTIDSLLKELFGTLRLQDSMLFLLPNLLRIDFSRSVKDIVEGLILTELSYIDRLNSSLPTTSNSSLKRGINYPLFMMNLNIALSNNQILNRMINNIIFLKFIKIL